MLSASNNVEGNITSDIGKIKCDSSIYVGSINKNYKKSPFSYFIYVKIKIYFI